MKRLATFLVEIIYYTLKNRIFHNFEINDQQMLKIEIGLGNYFQERVTKFPKHNLSLSF